MQLDEKLREMDREITVNPQYVQKVNVSPLDKIINSCDLVNVVR